MHVHVVVLVTLQNCYVVFVSVPGDVAGTIRSAVCVPGELRASDASGLRSQRHDGAAGLHLERRDGGQWGGPRHGVLQPQSVQ